MKKILYSSLLATIILSGCVSYGGNINEVSSHQIFGVYLRDNPNKYNTYEFNEDSTEYHSFGIKPPLPDDMFDSDSYSISLTKDNRVIKSIGASKTFNNLNECLANIDRYRNYLKKYSEIDREVSKGHYNSGSYNITYTLACPDPKLIKELKLEKIAMQFYLRDVRLDLK